MWLVPILVPITALPCSSWYGSFLSFRCLLFYHLFPRIVFADKNHLPILFFSSEMIFLFSSHSLLLFTVSQKKVQSGLFRVVVPLILSIDLFLSLFNRILWGKVSSTQSPSK